MSKITDAFMFRNEGDGCLTSKYFNNGLKTPLMEACKLDEDSAEFEIFGGKYRTVWLEQPGDSAEESTLVISKKTRDIFQLEWSQHGTLVYRGEGMITNGLLVGYYQSI